jgi:hypothetical protein
MKELIVIDCSSIIGSCNRQLDKTNKENATREAVRNEVGIALYHYVDIVQTSPFGIGHFDPILDNRKPGRGSTLPMIEEERLDQDKGQQGWLVLICSSKRSGISQRFTLYMTVNPLLPLEPFFGL